MPLVNTYDNLTLVQVMIADVNSLAPGGFQFLGR